MLKIINSVFIFISLLTYSIETFAQQVYIGNTTKKHRKLHSTELAEFEGTPTKLVDVSKGMKSPPSIPITWSCDAIDSKKKSVSPDDCKNRGEEILKAVGCAEAGDSMKYDCQSHHNKVKDYFVCSNPESTDGCLAGVHKTFCPRYLTPKERSMEPKVERHPNQNFHYKHVKTDGFTNASLFPDGICVKTPNNPASSNTGEDNSSKGGAPAAR